jgi:hypothetical protein
MYPRSQYYTIARGQLHTPANPVERLPDTCQNMSYTLVKRNIPQLRTEFKSQPSIIQSKLLTVFK